MRIKPSGSGWMVLKQSIQKSSFALFPPWVDTKNRQQSELPEGTLQNCTTLMTWSLSFQPSQLWQINVPPSVWYSVIAAWANWDKGHARKGTNRVGHKYFIYWKNRNRAKHTSRLPQIKFGKKSVVSESSKGNSRRLEGVFTPALS